MAEKYLRSEIILTGQFEEQCVNTNTQTFRTLNPWCPSVIKRRGDKLLPIIYSKYVVHRQITGVSAAPLHLQQLEYV